MNRKAWQKIVDDAKNGNESSFNTAVTSNYKEHFYGAILKLAKDDDTAKELYISAMTKFWERFILWNEPLPDTNIDGYIYLIMKNAFFETQQRMRSAKHNFISSYDSLELVEKYKSVVEKEQTIELNDDAISYEEEVSTIHEAVRSLDHKCKEIIEQNILLKITLQSLKSELGINGTYNAIVQKKKRCLKMLKRILSKKLKHAHFGLDNVKA